MTSTSRRDAQRSRIAATHCSGEDRQPFSPRAEKLAEEGERRKGTTQRRGGSGNGRKVYSTGW